MSIAEARNKPRRRPKRPMSEAARDRVASLMDCGYTFIEAVKYLRAHRVELEDRDYQKRHEMRAALLAVWKAIPVGTAVVVRLDGHGEEGEKLTTTRSEPWSLGDGTPVVLLDGFVGGYALERVRPVAVVL